MFFMSIPLALVGNVVRIFTTGIVAEAFGTDMAMQMYHDFSGFIIFMVVFILLISVGSLMERSWYEEKKRWWLGHLRTT